MNTGRQSQTSCPEDQHAIDTMPVPDLIRLYQSKATIQDVVNGNQKCLKNKIRNRFKRELGETFGDFEALKGQEFKGYVPSDKGYLLLFENEAEVRFLTNNPLM